MKREKLIILVVLIITSIIIDLLLIHQQLFSYFIVVTAALFVLTIYLITYLLENKDEESIYKSKLKRALKNYDAILVESQRFPELKGKNIIRVTNMDDLIDAQIEIRKPIYYMIENETGYVIDLGNWVTDNGNVVSACEKNSSTAQQWKLVLL